MIQPALPAAIDVPIPAGGGRTGKVSTDAIPEELKKLPQWVLWKAESSREGKSTKVPYQLNGLRASATNPEHWSTFAEIFWSEPVGYNGVGFVFTKDDPYVGIDLDDCRDPETGAIEEWAKKLVDEFNSYIEVSPSQTGLKIWCRGKLPIDESGKQVGYETGKVEMYQHSRYFTVTGQAIGGYEMCDSHDSVDGVWDRLFGWETTGGASEGVPLDQHPPTKLTPEEKKEGRRKILELSRSVSGERGSDKTIHALCEIIRMGFYGPELIEAAELYNVECCDPPWLPGELRRKIDAACKFQSPPGSEFSVVSQSTDDCKPPEDRSDSKSQEITYRRITSRELANGDFRVTYLIEDMLVKGQPLIVAGPQKVLKTSIMVDAAISLATGGWFLGYAKVNEKCRVAIMSGESGMATLQETAIRIGKAAKVELADIDNLIWSPDLPKFGDSRHAIALRKFLRADSIQVLVVDPAYLCMPGGDAGNLFIQGEMLHEISQLCDEQGVTLILAHHTKKMSQNGYGQQPLNLNDIAWSGFQEFARQWWLINRREAYEIGTGAHRLWLVSGGSAGHSSQWGLDITEGVRNDFEPRTWGVKVAVGAAANSGDLERQAKGYLLQDSARIVNVLRSVSVPISKSEARTQAKIRSAARGEAAISHLIKTCAVVELEYKAGNNQTYKGIALAENSSSDNE